jgi:hypothetical protein
MSVADLKVRLADVPGIEALTMNLEAGRILLRWGSGYAATVNASASDFEIERAVRDAIKLPPVTLIPDKQTNAGVTVPSASPAQPSAGPAMTNPASVGHTVKALMDEHIKMMGEIHAAQLEILRSNLVQQRTSVSSAVGAIASKIAAQTDEFNSIMGQFANDLGA